MRTPLYDTRYAETEHHANYTGILAQLARTSMILTSCVCILNVAGTSFAGELTDPEIERLHGYFDDCNELAKSRILDRQTAAVCGEVYTRLKAHYGGYHAYRAAVELRKGGLVLANDHAVPD